MDEDDPPLAWGSETSEEEIGDAYAAICDGHPKDTLLRMIREDGIFIGFEVAEVRTFATVESRRGVVFPGAWGGDEAGGRTPTPRTPTREGG